MSHENNNVMDEIMEENMNEIVDEHMDEEHEDSKFFSKRVSASSRTVTIDTGTFLEVEAEISKIKNIIVNNRFNSFEIRVILSNIVDEIEIILANKTKSKQDYDSLYDLIAFFYIYRYLGNDELIPIKDN